MEQTAEKAVSASAGWAYGPPATRLSQSVLSCRASLHQVLQSDFTRSDLLIHHLLDLHLLRALALCCLRAAA
jgi:hypothetical protein